MTVSYRDCDSALHCSSCTRAVQRVLAIGKPPAGQLSFFGNLKNVVVLPSVGKIDAWSPIFIISFFTSIRQAIVSFTSRWWRCRWVCGSLLTPSETDGTSLYHILAISLPSFSTSRYCLPAAMMLRIILLEKRLRSTGTALLRIYVISSSNTSGLMFWYVVSITKRVKFIDDLDLQGPSVRSAPGNCRYGFLCRQYDILKCIHSRRPVKRKRRRTNNHYHLLTKELFRMVFEIKIVFG